MSTVSILSAISILSLIFAFILLVIIFMISSFKRNYDYAVILAKAVTYLSVFATVTMLIAVSIK